MFNYLKNNVELIKYYEDYYKNSFDINKIKNDIIKRKINIELLDLYRFRIFLDACALLYNKDKIEKEYFANLFNDDIKNYLNNIKLQFPQAIDIIEKVFKTKIEDNLYFEFNKEENKIINMSLWEGKKILRNALAHMDYGSFISYGGEIYFFIISHKDEKGKNIEGIIVEPLFHALVHTYYLNSVQKSVAYKHTCIEINNKCTFKEIRYKGKEKYSGINRCHPMNHKAIYSKNLLIKYNFLKSHENDFEIKSAPIDSNTINLYENILYKYLNRKYTLEAFGYFIKSIYDIESTFSNFLTHLIQLNDTLIDYTKIVKSNKLDLLNIILPYIEELKEDFESELDFKLLFKLLYIINFSFYLEENNIENYELYKIHKYKNFFIFNPVQMVEFINKKILDNSIKIGTEVYGDIFYILTKIRNSVAHGRIRFEINNSKIYFVFQDTFYKRVEEVKIAVDDIDEFIKDINSFIS